MLKSSGSLRGPIFVIIRVEEDVYVRPYRTHKATIGYIINSTSSNY